MEKIEILQQLYKRTDIIWQELCHIHPRLAEHRQPEILLNNRLYRTAGRAWQEDGIVELGTKFLLHSNKYRVIMLHTILPHELAHIADYMLWGESEKNCGHGKNWQMLMLQLGLEPDPYHTMDLKKC